jgi:hypothetical protein
MISPCSFLVFLFVFYWSGFVHSELILSFNKISRGDPSCFDQKKIQSEAQLCVNLEDPNLRCISTSSLVAIKVLPLDLNYYRY